MNSHLEVGTRVMTDRHGPGTITNVDKMFDPDDWDNWPYEVMPDNEPECKYWDNGAVVPISEEVTVEDTVEDAVNHPSHYKQGMPEGVEVIDIIEAQEFDFYLANTTKYLLRAQYKGRLVEDLKKAQWYLERKISRLEIERLKNE